MKINELESLTDIYHEHGDYDVVLWDPVNQKQYDLIFTGSSKPEKRVNFNIREHSMSESENRRIEILNEVIMLNRYKTLLENKIDELKNKLE